MSGFSGYSTQLNSSFATQSTQRTRTTRNPTHGFQYSFTSDVLTDQEIQDKLELLRKQLDLVRSDSQTKKLKTIKQKQEAKESIKTLMDRLRGSICAGKGGDVYSLGDLMHDLVCATQDELEENEEKYVKSKSSTRATTLTFTVTDVCTHFTLAIVTKDLIQSDDFSILELCCILQKSIFNEEDGRYESITREILFNYAECVPVFNWNSANFARIFRNCRSIVNRPSKLLTRLQNSQWKRAEHWIRVATLCVQNIGWTSLSSDMHTNVIGLLEEICEVLEGKGNEFWPRRSSCTAALFDLFSLIIDNCAIDYRSVLIERLTPIAISSLEQLNGIWGSVLANQEKNMIEKSGASLWTFLERVIALNCPGGFFSPLIAHENIGQLARIGLPLLMGELQKACTSNMRTPFELPECRVVLIARLLAISEIVPMDDSNSGNPAKRSRERSPIETFCDCDWDCLPSVPSSLLTLSLRVLLSFFSTFSKWIAESRTMTLAINLWQVRNKFSRHPDLFCIVLSECVRLGHLSSILTDVSSWIVSEGFSGESVAALSINILKSRESTSLSSFPVIVDVLSRGTVLQTTSMQLLMEAFRRCRVDEMSTVSKRSLIVDEDFPSTWKLRCSLIQWVLSAADCDIVNFLLEISLHYQCSTSEKERATAACCLPGDFECKLCVLLDLERKSKKVGETMCKEESDSPPLPQIPIPEVVQCIVKLFCEQWDKETDTTRHLWLWRQGILFQEELRKYEWDIRLREDYRKFREDADLWLCDNLSKLSPNEWKLVDVGKNNRYFHGNLKDMVLELAQQDSKAAVAALRLDGFATENPSALLDLLLLCTPLDSETIECTSVIVQELLNEAPIESWIETVDNYGSLLSLDGRKTIIEGMRGHIVESRSADQLEEGEEKRIGVLERHVHRSTMQYMPKSDLQLLTREDISLCDPSIVIDRLVDLHPDVLWEMVPYLVQNTVLIPAVVSVVLDCSPLWEQQLPLMETLCASAANLQFCYEFVGNFSLCMEFHSIALLSITESFPNIQQISHFNLLQSDKFIQWCRSIKKFGKGRELEKDGFPTAFRAHPQFLPDVCVSFGRLYSLVCPLDLLAWLRSEDAVFREARQEIRYMALLEMLTQQFVESIQPDKHAPFVGTVSTVAIGLFKSVTKRNIPRHELSILISQWKNICGLLPDIGQIVNLRIKEIIEEYKKSDCPLLEVAVAPFVEEFVAGKWIDESVLLMTSFWRALSARLEEPGFNPPFPHIILDNILLLWDWVPSLREVMAATVAVLTQKLAALPYLRDLAEKENMDGDFLDHLLKFAKVTMANESETRFEVVRCALRLLSCVEFGDDRLIHLGGGEEEKENEGDILQQSHGLSQVATESILAGSARDVSEVCGRILRLLDVENAVIRTLIRYISHLPSLSLSLTPYICSFDRVRAVTVVFNCDVWTQRDISPRVIRCLAECIDSIGISQLSIHPIVFSDPERLRSLSSVLIRTGYCEHAKLLFHLYTESILDATRGDVALVSLSAHSHPLTLSHPACQLSADLHSATRDAAALRALPSKFQMMPSVRNLLLFESSDWIRLICDSVECDEEMIGEAAFASGIPMREKMTRDDLLYRDAWRMRSWDTVAFPKDPANADSTVFSLVSLSRNSQTETYLKEAARVFRIRVEKALSHADVVDKEYCRNIAKLKLCERETTVRVETTPPSNGCLLSALSSSFVISHLYRTPSDQKREILNQRADTVMEYVKRLVKEDKYKPALRVLDDLRSVSVSVGDLPMRDRCILEATPILQKTGECLMAEQSIVNLVESGGTDVEILVSALCHLSQIRFDTGSDYEEALGYVRRAREVCVKSGSISSASRASVFSKLYHLACGQLADIEAYRESRGFRMKKEAIAKWTEEIKEMEEEERKGRGDRQRKGRIQNERRCEQTDVKMTNLKAEKGAELAVGAGLEAINHGDVKESARILFSVIDLLFRYGESVDGEESEVEKKVVEVMKCHIRVVDVSKWLPSISHICAHAFKRTPLGVVIRELVIKLVEAFPFHTLNTVYFYEDGREKSPIVGEIVRTAALKQKEVMTIAREMKIAHRTYKDFCSLDIAAPANRMLFKGMLDADGKTVYKMSPTVELLQRMKLLTSLPLPVVEHKHSHPFNYSRDQFILWVSADENCQRADGLSTPTVLTVRGSDGKKYKTIWKREDVRQDCLVEQIFSVVNTLVGNKEDLQPLRTYKVVPLDEKNGIIEWCMGTTSIKTILCGDDRKSGLHKEIYPMDITARDALVALSSDNCPPDQKLRVFNQVCGQFRPVFRHFFYQNYSVCGEWSKRLNAYTRSLAQWSIVCYVIGLGDRHTSNILFEPDTAKFVHIDLGMILEFSKRILPVPESVPFRMTRDFIDPILPDSIHGRMEAVAVETMHILRENRQVILGLASVFLRESMSSYKEKNGSGRSYLSETAISRLRDKLDGMDGCVTKQTATLQVRRLLKEATNRENLSRIFCGWMPFM